MFYLQYIGYELKKMWRDSMTRFMLFFPLLYGGIVRFVIPYAEKQAGSSFSPYYHVVLAALALLVPRICGSVIGFTILDDRDDNVVYAVRVAPLSLEFFIGMKLAITFLFGFVGTAFVVWFANLTTVSPGLLFSISALSALSGPITALAISCIAKNKIEGFAALKSLNGLIVAPIVSLFFWDAKELLFAIEPGFWPAKAFSAAMLGENLFRLSYSSYLGIGFAYALVGNLLLYKIFRSKID